MHNGQKDKAQRGKKFTKHREREFTKGEADFIIEKEVKEKREDHIKKYGVASFESSSESEEPPKRPLEHIHEKDEDEDALNSDGEKPRLPDFQPTPQSDDFAITFGEEARPVPAEEGVIREEKGEKAVGTGSKPKEALVDVSEEDMERLRRVRE